MDPLYGGACSDAPRHATHAVPTDCFAILNINVTLLNRSRLLTILQHAVDNNISAITLQETRHRSLIVPWAQKLAAQAGFAIAFSHPPIKPTDGSSYPGGAAVLWLHHFGKCSLSYCPIRPTSSIKVTFKDFSINSCYGPCSRPDPDWFQSSIRCDDQGAHRQCIAVGDYNWRSDYDDLIPWFFQLAPVFPTTVHSTCITRCLFSHNPGVDVRFVEARALPDIPVHFGVIYSFMGSFTHCLQPRPTSRLVRCGQYSRSSEEIIDNGHDVMTKVNLRMPPLDASAPLADRWKNWHYRAELTFAECTKLNLATCSVKPERRKGSRPATKNVAASCKHRDAEPIAARRLKRIHRGLAHRLLVGGDVPSTQCHAADAKRWCAAVHDGLLPSIETSQYISYALSVIDLHLRDVNLKWQIGNSIIWRKQFFDFQDSTWKAAGHIMHPSGSCQMDVQDIADYCEEKWKLGDLDPISCAQHWTEHAQEQDLHLSYQERRSSDDAASSETIFGDFAVPSQPAWLPT